MIKRFKNTLTESIFHGETVKKFDKKLSQKARMRLELLNAAAYLEDLYFPPSNKFHALQGFDLKRYAIWVNQQWRITFSWQDNHATDVCLEDYH